MKTLNPLTALLRGTLITLLGFALQGVGHALTVTNNQDNASPTAPLITGSLRWAIANTPANGVVNFAPCMTGKTIVLQAGQLVISNTLTIQGPGCSALTVSGNNLSRIFYVTSTGPASTVISDITMTKGNAVGSVTGGTLPDAIGGPRQNDGGAIQNAGYLQIIRCCITNNKAPLGSGGGIYNYGTIASITESTVSYNTAGQDGGGIFDEQDMTIVRTSVCNNTATGDGGGVLEAGTAIYINSTFASNRAGGAGGGINDPGYATLNTYNVTIAGNVAATGGGLSTQGPGNTWALANTIVGSNSAASCPDVSNPFGFPVSAPNGHNLIQNTNGGTLGGLDATDITGKDPTLGPLQNNGGPTLTRALLPGSPAIDAGANSNVLPSMTTDQRVYMSRIINGGISLTVDIGAYEYSTARALKNDAITVLTPCLSSTDCGTVLWARSAIRSIQCSLTPSLWTNDTTLASCGSLVFEYEEDAAYALELILQYSSDPACVQAAGYAIQDLLDADEQLARWAIATAVTCRGDANLINSANCEIVTAQSCIAQHDYQGAIEHYEHAWEIATNSCGCVCDDNTCRQQKAVCDQGDYSRWGDNNRCNYGN